MAMEARQRKINDIESKIKQTRVSNFWLVN